MFFKKELILLIIFLNPFFGSSMDIPDDARAPTGKVNPILLGGDPATKALAEQLGR